jgi:RNA polymerase sigma-70 factor (ECF subfamily)
MSPFYLDGTIGIEMTFGNTNRREGVRVLDERDLVAAAQSGKPGAFEALVQPHSKKILRAIRRITRNREDAEDALQDTFLKAFTHIKSFDGRAKFSTWLTRIAINSALTTVRTNSSTLASRMEAYGDNGRNGLDASPDRAPNPEAAFVQHERGVFIRRAIRALAPTIRQAFTLQRFHELSLKETAEKMGISIPATKSRLLRARADLRRTLAERSL